jgi:hypothetical protein
MTRPTIRWTRWLAPLLALLVPASALAKPRSPERQAVARKYDGARITNLQAQAQATQLKQQMHQLRLNKAGREQLKQVSKDLATAQSQARAAKAEMLMAHAEGLLSKAAALEKSDPGRANTMLDKAIRLEAQAKALRRALPAPSEAAKPAPATEAKPKANPAAEREPPPVPAAQARDTEKAPGVDGPTAAAAKVRGMASRQGKRSAMLQLESGNISGAMATLARMEAQANRGGVMGLVDRYRKWTTKNQIIKQSYKLGKAGARQGDAQMAGDAVSAISTLGKGRWGTKGKIDAIAKQAMKGAASFSKHNRPEETRQLLDLARSIQKLQGRERPTLRYRFVRWNAKRRLMKDIELRAKQGNIEAFRSAMRLASAYAKEDGRAIKPGELAKIKELYISALKNSVVRSLDDAHALLSGKMGYVNPEEAATRYLYAMETHDKLAARGIKVKTGLFHRSVGSKFARVRAALVKAQQDGGLSEVKKPGLAKRIVQALFVPEHKRVRPGIAPVDSAWLARQQRAQQAEMERVAAEQQLQMGGEGAAN